MKLLTDEDVKKFYADNGDTYFVRAEGFGLITLSSLRVVLHRKQEMPWLQSSLGMMS